LITVPNIALSDEIRKSLFQEGSEEINSRPVKIGYRKTAK